MRKALIPPLYMYKGKLLERGILLSKTGARPIYSDIDMIYHLSQRDRHKSRYYIEN